MSLSIRDSHYSNNPLEALNLVEKHGKKVNVAMLKRSLHQLKLYPIDYHLAIASCRNSSPYYPISQFLVQSPPDSRTLEIADPGFSEKWIENFVDEYHIKYGLLKVLRATLRIYQSWTLFLQISHTITQKNCCQDQLIKQNIYSRMNLHRNCSNSGISG